MTTDRPRWTLTDRLLVLLPAALAVLLYGYTLQLPFFLDDGLLFAMIRDHPGGVPGFMFWGGSPSFPYYRPLVFSLWEWQGLALGGRWEPVTWHALNVVLYALTAVGLAVLVRRVGRSMMLALLAAFAFVIFPFNFNAVQWVASLFHLLALAGLVLALLAGLDIADGWRGMVAWVTLALAAFVAIFSHETGVLLLPLLAGLYLAVHGRAALTNRRVWGALVLVGVMCAIFAVLFLTMPRAGGATALQLDQLADNAGALLHGLAWPLGALLRIATGVEGATALFVALAVVTVAGLLAAVWVRRRDLLPLALYGLGWYALAILPAALFLETNYILGSWRLLYLASPGAALLWGCGLVALWTPTADSQRSRRLLARGAVAIVIVWSVGVGVIASLQRQDESLRQAAFLYDVQAVVDAHATGDAPLIVNAPAFLAPSDPYRLFPVRGMGVIFLADFANYDRLITAEIGDPFPYLDALAWNDIVRAPAWLGYATYQTFPFGTDFTTQVRAASDLFVTHFDGDRFYPLFVGRAGEAGFDETLVDFPGSGVVLTDAQAELTAPDRLTITLRWRADDPRDVRPVVTVTCDGEVIGTSDRMPWGESHPFRVWTAGETQTERRVVRLSRDVDAACLSVTATLRDESGDATYPPQPEGWSVGVE